MSDWEDVTPKSKAAESDWEEVSPSSTKLAKKEKTPYVSPGGDDFVSRISDPNRWQAILSGKGPAAPEVAAGHAPLAMPMAQAPAALSALASYLGGSGVGPALGRITANTGLGYAQGGQEGAVIGGLVGVGGELVSPALQLVKWGGRNLARMTKPQAEAYLKDPAATGSVARMIEDPSRLPELQDQAAAAIESSRRMLKQKGLQNASKVSQALQGKHIEINPQALSGTVPEVDQALQPFSATIRGNPGEKVLEDNVLKTVGATPDKQVLTDAVSVPGNFVNSLKRTLQEAAKFRPGTVTDPVQAAKMAEAASKSHQLRTAIEQAAPEVAALNQESQLGLLLQKSLRQGQQRPLAFLKSQADDTLATLARVEQQGAGGLLDFGNRLGAAKTMTTPDTGSGVPTFLGKLGGRLLLRSADAAKNAVSTYPVANDQVLRSLFADENKK